jgi:hypothetical protein
LAILHHCRCCPAFPFGAALIGAGHERPPRWTGDIR